MIAWMFYAAAVGGLFTLAAIASERLLRLRRRPARLVWVASMAASIAWPLVPLALTTPAPPQADASASAAWLPAVAMTEASSRIAAAGAALPAGVRPVLLGTWIAASLLLLIRIGVAIRTLRRRRRTWERREVDEVQVLVSRTEGPAVVGVLRPEIVLPEWVLTAEPSVRALVVQHEQEHRRAGDPLLLLAAAVAVALMPWNPALWVQSRRLRLAMEIDCDGRVLRHGVPHDRYGLVLLTLAQRRSRHPILAAALAERTSHLERRIIAMNTPLIRHPRATALGLTAATVLALVVACTADAPPAPAVTGGDAPAAAAAAPVYLEFQVERAVSTMPGTRGPRYPEMLRNAGVEGEVVIQFVVDTAGRVDMNTFRVVRSTHELFSRAVRDQLPEIRFRAAELDGRPVRQQVQMPYVFSLAR